ncbi:SIMPL domain-containing protein [Rhodobacteraceae bacterium F11138]|nr:SIMPL domain-containing protein [Rhodobacteraceae bacterium F11138]
MKRALSMATLSGIIALSMAGEALAETESRLITVTGEGRIEAVPDMATVTLGVTNEAPEAKAAMDATSAAVAQVLDRLQAMGLEPRDIQTQRFSLNPVWSDRGYSDGKRPEITGFVASNMVMARVRDIETLGPVLDAVISEGANDFNGLQFGVQDNKPLIEAARKEAVEDGIAKARQLAEAAGVTLGPVVSIADHGGNNPRPMKMELASARDGSMPVAAGEISLTASVSMVFSISD